MHHGGAGSTGIDADLHAARPRVGRDVRTVAPLEHPQAQTPRLCHAREDDAVSRGAHQQRIGARRGQPPLARPRHLAGFDGAADRPLAPPAPTHEPHASQPSVVAHDDLNAHGISLPAPRPARRARGRIGGQSTGSGIWGGGDGPRARPVTREVPEEPAGS